MKDQNIIFVLTREDVLECARKKGIPEGVITDEVMCQAERGLNSERECWSKVVMAAIDFALKS